MERMKNCADGACKQSRAVVAGGFGALVMLPALGQDQIEEVVVTAQKRTENIQNVPIAVTAFGAAQIERSGASNISQLSNLAPNVNLDAGTPFSGSDTVLSAYIRGI